MNMDLRVIFGALLTVVDGQGLEQQRKLNTERLVGRDDCVCLCCCCCGLLWVVVGCCGFLWVVVGCCGLLWVVVDCFGYFWGHCGSFWITLVHFGSFWVVLHFSYAVEMTIHGSPLTH